VEKPAHGLLRVHQMGFSELLKRIRPEEVCGLSVRGKQIDMQDFARHVAALQNPCVAVGGFPRGHFSAEVEKTLDVLVRIDPRPLEAHVVAARVVYEIEKATKGFND
jgi:rRNA small subunit pseudouridine methyltransferase Nep1